MHTETWLVLVGEAQPWAGRGLKACGVARSRVSLAGVVCTLLFLQCAMAKGSILLVPWSLCSAPVHAWGFGGAHGNDQIQPLGFNSLPVAPTAKHTAVGCLSSNSLSDHTSCFRGDSKFADAGVALLGHAHSLQHR